MKAIFDGYVGMVIVRSLSCLQTRRLARGEVSIVGRLRCWHDRAGCGCALGVGCPLGDSDESRLVCAVVVGP